VWTRKPLVRGRAKTEYERGVRTRSRMRKARRAMMKKNQRLRIEKKTRKAQAQRRSLLY